MRDSAIWAVNDMSYKPKYYDDTVLNMDYEHTEAHQRAYDIAVDLHKRVCSFPNSEKFVLQQEIRQNSNNICKELELFEKTKYIKHLYNADNYKSDLVRNIRMSFDLKYINKRSYEYVSREIGKLGTCIGSLIKSK